MRNSRLAVGAVSSAAVLTLVFGGAASASAAPTPVVPFANCAQARAAGAAPILASDPRFQPKLDRNHNGVGCEDGDNGVSIPAPVDCPTAVAGLVRVQLAEDRDAKAIRQLTAERNHANTAVSTATGADTADDVDDKVGNSDSEDLTLNGAKMQLDMDKEGLATVTANDGKEDSTLPLKADDPAKPDTEDIAVAGDTAAVAHDQKIYDDALAADSKEDGNGVTESPADTADGNVKAAKLALAKAQRRLDDAAAAKARDDLALVTVNIALQACQGAPGVPAIPVTPAPVVPASPAPVVSTDGNPGPITIINSQAPVPVIQDSGPAVTH